MIRRIDWHLLIQSPMSTNRPILFRHFEPLIWSQQWQLMAISSSAQGAVNYVAVADATELSASVQSAGLAADNLVCAGEPLSP